MNYALSVRRAGEGAMPASKVEPHFFSDRLHELVGFYERALGFELAQRHPDGDDYTWCELTRGDVGLMFSTPLGEAPAPGCVPLWEELSRRRGQPGDVITYLQIEDVDELYAQAKREGANVLEELWDAWWGTRQFTVADPDGNLLAFARSRT
jgi:uncharacterized glyoxalase superfamily protein PhnB